MDEIINHALIMAAGRGARMRPLTNNIPKAMAPLSGSTLIAKKILHLKKNIKNVHITVGYKGSVLAKHVIEKDVSSVINTEGRGNAWWIYNSLMKYIDEPILVLTCDNFYEFNLEQYKKDYIKKSDPACMIIPALNEQTYEADKVMYNNKNLILDINRNIESKTICSGVQVINPYKINKKTKASENFLEIWKQLIIQKDIYCSKYYLKNWYAVDNLSQLQKINKITK